jgi:hypothetical protein
MHVIWGVGRRSGADAAKKCDGEVRHHDSCSQVHQSFDESETSHQSCNMFIHLCAYIVISIAPGYQLGPLSRQMESMHRLCC